MGGRHQPGGQHQGLSLTSGDSRGRRRQLRVSGPHVQLARVLLQIKVATEALGADVASEGLAIVVGVHVEGEIVHLVESLAAQGALVGLFAAVGQFVVLVVALLVEALSTGLAYEWFHPGVDASVSVEG